MFTFFVIKNKNIHILYQGGKVMINKQGLWFLTLFSLILVLSIYYITMPNEVFQNEVIETEKSNKVEKEEKEETKEVNKTNTSYIETLKIELDSERADILDTLQEVINDSTKTSDEKNKAYEQMKEINNLKSSEDQLIKKIKEEHSLEAYVKQDDTKIEVVIESEKHDVKLANKIMRTIQEEFDVPMSISIKFS